MYDDVYPTKDDRWAGTGQSLDYGNIYNKVKKIQPEYIAFSDSVWFDLNQMTEIEKTLYQEPYYRFESNKAFPLMGNYIEELFFLKKRGVLKKKR